MSKIISAEVQGLKFVESSAHQSADFKVFVTPPLLSLLLTHKA